MILFLLGPQLCWTPCGPGLGQWFLSGLGTGWLVWNIVLPTVSHIYFPFTSISWSEKLGGGTAGWLLSLVWLSSDGMLPWSLLKTGAWTMPTSEDNSTQWTNPGLKTRGRGPHPDIAQAILHPACSSLREESWWWEGLSGPQHYNLRLPLPQE